jgi:sugar/nucleoside kinase (ribokinase family)
MTLSAPLVVVGSANADIFVEVDTLPKEGERIVAKSGQTFAGGKGAIQASCAARLSYPTYFVGQVWNALLLLFLLASIRHPHVSASLDRPRLER